MSTKQNKKPGFNFLSDDAIREIKNDKLKHSSIADALKNIIINCPLPFTIGVFGKWGTGKTTIANFLKSRLKAQDKTVAVVDFDVWKYEDDSLRRYFLINLVAKLKEQKFLPDNYELDERVENSTSRSFEGALKLSWAKVVRFWYVIAIFLAGIALGGLLIYFIFPPFLQTYFASVISLGFTTSAILFLFQVGSEIFTTETKTLSQERLKDAHEFEKEFGKIIDDTKVERILVIIDNLDRCTHSKAVELLSTVKTFLEPKRKKCIFLIQCDEDAIKKHLENVYIRNKKLDSKNEAFDADEFLRKFFNTSIKIPPFIGADLEEYTKELLEESGERIFHNNSDLVSVITQAFRENPRQIKQFINTLLSHYLVALERESGLDPVIKSSGVITGNLPFLAKFLIIRQKWPPFYKAIVEEPKNLEDYSSQVSEIKDFMGGTSLITTDNLRTFIYLKQSEHKLRLPGNAGDELEIAFEDNRGEAVIKIIKELKEKGAKDNEVTDFIAELIKDNKGKKQNLINIINLTARSKKELAIEFQETFSENVAEVIRTELLNQLYALDLNFTFFVINKSRAEIKNQIISQYINILGSAKKADVLKQIPDYNNYVLRLTNYLNNNQDLLNHKIKDIKKALTEAHFDNIDLLAIFEKNTFAIGEFISSELLIKLIGSITDTDISTAHSTGGNLLNRKIEFLLKCKKIIDTTVVETTINKFTELFTTQNNSPESTEKESYLKLLLEKTGLILKRYSETIQDSQKTDDLSEVVMQGINKYVEQEKKSWFIPVLLYLSNIASDTKRSTIEQAIKDFTQNATASVVGSFFADKDKKFQQAFFLLTKEGFETRAVKEQDIFDIIWGLEDEKERDSLLAKLVGTPNYTLALDKLKNINYKVVNPQNIVNLLLNKAASLAVSERPPLFNAINKMKCARNKELRETYTELLKGMIINQDAVNQEVAYNAYVEARKFLPHLLKLPLTVAVIDSLSSLDPININHKFALKTAFLYWDKISSTHKDNLVTIVLDRIIAKTSSEEDISMAFDVLYTIKPRYTKYKPHFDIALSRVESEQNAPLKAAIKAGLQKLKPQKAKLKNSFWGRVNKL